MTINYDQKGHFVIIYVHINIVTKGKGGGSVEGMR